MRTAHRSISATLICAAAALLAGIGHLSAQTGPLTGEAAFGDWRTDKPGIVRLIRPGDLPKPGATPSSTNVSRVVARPPSARPLVPAGFKAELFADGLSGPRQMRVAPNGDIFVAETRAGRIRVLRSAAGDSKPALNEIFAGRLNRPFGIAFFPSGDDPKWIYVANTDSVVRFPYTSGETKAAGEPETVVAKLPTGGHSTRDIVFSKDNKRMMVSVGSASNDGEGMGAPPAEADWRHGSRNSRSAPPGVMKPVAPAS